MKIFSKISLLLACLVAAHLQASQPTNNRFDRCSFFAGVGTTIGIPAIAFGQALHRIAKKDLAKGRYEQGKEGIVIGRCFKGAGAGLIVVPFLVMYRRQLLPFLYK